MRVLITWGSKRGGTAGIAETIGEALERRGFDVVLGSAEDVDSLEEVDAVVVGGALYANRWPLNVRRFVQRNVEALRKVPVWFFSSGPLDDSADRQAIPATREVGVLAERVGARGHVTFGGRLEAEAEGFPAAAMAKESAGDWRNRARITAWAVELADALPNAKPGEAIDHPARSAPRLVAHGVLGWALTAATMIALLKVVSFGTALVIQAVAAPLFFLAISHHYFAARGAHDPAPTAFVFAWLMLVLDVAVFGGFMGQGLAMIASVSETWLPVGLTYLATWLTGTAMATMPWAASSGPSVPTQRPVEG